MSGKTLLSPAKHEKILDVVGPVKTTVELEPALFLPKGNPALHKIENCLSRSWRSQRLYPYQGGTAI